MTEANDLLETARKLMESQNYCTLITGGAAGSPNARVVQPLPLEADFTLWFGTSPRSRKVQDIRHNPAITVLYFIAHGMSYITLQGDAKLVDDLEQRKSRWAEGWHMFFPDGPEGDDYMLIQFTPKRIELMSFEHNITPPPFGLVPAVLTRQDDNWIVSEAYRHP
ncbi:MAG: pyridoxamine 5'-phosphate oxidase family protein [Anaerolineae bacterium]